MKIGQIVKLLREKNNISREALAKTLKVTTNYVYIFEAGDRNLSFEMIEKLSNFFNIPAAYFFVLADESVSNDEKRSRKTKDIMRRFADEIKEDLGIFTLS